MPCQLIEISALDMQKSAAFGAFQVIVRFTISAFIYEFKACALTLFCNVFTHKALLYQLIKVPINRRLADRPAILCKLGYYIVGREMPARLLLQKGKNQAALLSII